MTKDGIKYCENCGEPMQKKIEFQGKTHIVNIVCSCKKEPQEKKPDKSRCFSARGMQDWTFENDDGQNKEVTVAMKNYADNFEDFKREGQGILLYGGVGSGKSYMAASVANKLLDKGYKVYMTNFSALTNELFSAEDKQGFIRDVNRNDLLIIDDLGTERNTEYMQEQIFNVIDERYRRGMPMVITTNLTVNELKSPSDITRARIMDRILEKCYPIKVEVQTSRRLENLRKTYPKTKERLGL